MAKVGKDMQRKARAKESIVLRRLGCALRSEAVALQSHESFAAAMVCKDLQRHRIALVGEAVARRGEALLGSERKQRRWNDLIC